MPRRIIPRQPSFDFLGVLRDYLLNRSAQERASTHETVGKGRLMEYLRENGEEVEGGHREIVLDQPENFVTYRGDKPKAQVVKSIMRQKRVSTRLNEDRTMALLKELDLLKECTEVVVVLDEDAVLAANYSGKISDDDLKACYDTTENYAFILNTENL